MRTSHALAAASATPHRVRPARLLATLTAALALACALGAPAARAQSDAFSAEVAVADRGAAEREAAYAEALRRVLLDNAADRTLMNRDDVRAALREADAYVETFRFDVPAPGTGIPPGTSVTDAVRRSGEAEGLLLVRLDRARVLALLEAAADADRDGAAPPAGTGTAGAAVPGPVPSSGPAAERAFEGVGSALVWLLVEDGDRLVAGSDPAALKVRERLREIAGGAGVTLAFGDAADLDVEALRALDAEAVRAASLRYATDAVLVGRLARGLDDPVAGPGVGPGVAPADPVADPAANGPAGIDLRGRVPGAGPDADAPAAGWRGEWLKAIFPEASEGDGPAADGRDEARPAPSAVALRTVTRGRRLDDALRDGLGWLLPGAASGVGAGYAYGGGGDATEGLVWVGSLDSIGEYARVMALFESVGEVDSVYPRAVADGAGVFAVRPRRALNAIAAAAAGTGLLRPGVPPLETVEPADESVGAPGARGRGTDDGFARRATRGASFSDLARQADLAFDAVP